MNTMKKQVFALLLAIALIVSMIPATVMAVEDNEQVLYENTFDADLDTSTWGTNPGTPAENRYAKVVDCMLELNPTGGAAMAMYHGSTLQGKFAFEIDAVSNKVTDNYGAFIKLGNNAYTDSAVKEQIVYVKLHNNKVVYGNGKSYAMTIAANNTYRVKLIVDVDAQTYDIYIDDEVVATGVPFAASVTSIDRIRLTTSSSTVESIVKFDNLKIYVPDETVEEPEEPDVNPYLSANLTLTGKPTLVLKYEPAADDAVENFTTVLDIPGVGPVAAEVEDGVYVFRIPVTATQLVKPIKATLMNDETQMGSGEFVLANYAAGAKEIDPSTSDLLDSLMAYSNYAAAFNGSAETEDFASALAITELTGYETVVDKSEIKGIGVVPVLNDAADLYFTFPEGIQNYTVKVNNEVVDLVDTTGNKLNITKPYCYAIKEILPQDWADAYVVEVYDGETLKTRFSYSVLSYVQKKLGDNNEELANLVKAMYIYHRDAEMYARTAPGSLFEGFSDSELSGWSLPTSATSTQPKLEDGRLVFDVPANSTENNGSLVRQEINNATNNCYVMVIDVDFQGPTNSAPVEISVGPTNATNSYVLRTIINANQLRHVQATTVTAANAANGYKLEINKTHHARIVLNMLTQKYDVYIDGVRWIAGASAMSSFAYNANLELRMGMFGSGKDATLYFDNVKVSKLNASSVDPTTTGLTTNLYSDSNLQDTDNFTWGFANASIEDGKLVVKAVASAAMGVLTPKQPLTGKYSVEINVNSNEYTDNNGAFIKLGNSAYAVATVKEQIVYVKLHKNKVAYGDNKSVTMNIAANEDYRVKFIVDTNAQTYDIYINGQLVAEGVAFSAEVNSIDKIRLGRSANTSTLSVKYENLKISQILQ